MATSHNYALRSIIFFLCLFIVNHLSAQTFSLKAGTHRGSIQWEESFNKKVWTNVVNGNRTSVDTKPDKTTYYRAKITESDCAPVYSDIKAAILRDDLVLGAKMIIGKVTFPEGSTIENSKLTVFSFIDTSSVKPDGSFEILVADSTEETMLFVLNEKNQPLLFGYYVGNEEEYTLSSNSTGLCLLTMYPYAEPITVERKKELLDKYAEQTEFKDLVVRFDGALKGGQSPILSLNNEGKELLYKLITKDFNSFRFSKGDSDLNPNILGPNEFKDYDQVSRIVNGSIVTLKNTMAFSYVGGIYDKNDNKLHSFFLPGELLSSSRIIRAAMDIFRPSEIKINSFETAQSIEVKELMKDPGQYEIRLRNGSYKDGGEERELAFKNNIGEGTSALILNVVPAFFQFIPKSCASSILLNVIDYTKNGAEFTPDKNIAIEFLLPGIRYAIDIGVDCAGDAVRKPLSVAFSAISFAYDIQKEWPSFKYFPSLISEIDQVDFCHLKINDLQYSSCFVVVPESETIKPAYYTGDVVNLKVKSLENKNYYPYSEAIVPNVSFTYLTTLGDAFVENLLNYSTQTDNNGLNVSKWYMPCTQEGENGVKIVLPGEGVDEILQKDFIFKARSYNPRPEVYHVGNNQEGEPGIRVKNDLIINVNDVLDGLPMLMDRFKIDWKITEGTGSIEKVISSTPFDSTFAWILGPELGRQSATATVYVKNEYLKWEILGSPINYVANDTKVDTFFYVANYWVPGTIVNNYIYFKLHFENGIITGTCTSPAFYLTKPVVTGTYTKTDMTIIIEHDNGIHPTATDNGYEGLYQKWTISGTTNADHSTYKATYKRKVTHRSGYFTSGEWVPLIQHTEENGNLTY